MSPLFLPILPALPQSSRRAERRIGRSLLQKSSPSEQLPANEEDASIEFWRRRHRQQRHLRVPTPASRRRGHGGRGRNQRPSDARSLTLCLSPFVMVGIRPARGRRGKKEAGAKDLMLFFPLRRHCFFFRSKAFDDVFVGAAFTFYCSAIETLLLLGPFQIRCQRRRIFRLEAPSRARQAMPSPTAPKQAAPTEILLLLLPLPLPFLRPPPPPTRTSTETTSASSPSWERSSPGAPAATEGPGNGSTRWR